MNATATDSEVSPGPTAGMSLLPALALGLSVAICHGIGRFAYALLMPAMMASLGWGYEQASWINTANAAGYVVGTVSGFVLLRRISATAIFASGLLCTCASVALMAGTTDFHSFILLRLLAGLGAAWAFSTGGAIVGAMYAEHPRQKGAATALFFGSAGIGVIATGALVPALLHSSGDRVWPQAWMYLGLICFALAPFAIAAARRVHAPPTGSARIARGALAASWVSMLSYLMFAAAHTGYIFFIFAWTRSASLSWQHGAGMWVLLGIGMLLSFWLWKRPMSGWGGTRILAACCMALAVGAGLPLLHLSVWTVYLSALLVGGSLFIGPSAIAVLVRQSLPQPFWGAGLMVFSVVFALGQSLASWAFGRAADSYPLSLILAASSIGLLVASLIAMADRRRFS